MEKSLSYKVDKLFCISTRLCAVLIFLNAFTSIPLFIVYMPCDVRHYGDNFNTYHDVLNEIDTYV